MISIYLIGFKQNGYSFDAESKTPYQILVLIQFPVDDHFTPFLRKELLRQTHHQLQAAMKGFSQIEVHDLDEIDKKKLNAVGQRFVEKGFEGLDGANELDGIKTICVQFAHSQGEYTISLRQHDGNCGYTDQKVRKEITIQRSFISRLLSRMLDRDLGIVATFEPRQGEKKVTLQFQSGELTSTWGKWVKPGDVFAVMQIKEMIKRAPTPPRPAKNDPKGKNKKNRYVPPPPPTIVRTGTRVEGTLVRVTSEVKQGICEAEIFERYNNSMPVRKPVIGYRCIKLGAIQSNVKLRFIDMQGRPITSNLVNVRIHSERFPDRANDGDDMQMINGIFYSKKRYNQLACIRVSLGEKLVAQIPIELLEDSVNTRQLRLEANADQKARIDQLRRDLLYQIVDLRRLQNGVFRELIAMETAGERQDALQRGKLSYASLEIESNLAKEEFTRLQQKLIQEKTPGNPLADCDQHLQLLLKGQQDLKKHLEDLETIIKADNDPSIVAKRKKIQEDVRQAELLLQQGEFEKALAKYKEIIAEVEDNAGKEKFQKIYDQIQESWKVKDEEHQQARKFFLEVWPKLSTLVEIETNLPLAKKSFAKCKAVKDRLTLIRFIQTAPEVLAKATEEITRLSESTEEDGQTKLMKYKPVVDELDQFIKEVTLFFQQKQ